MSEPSDAWDHCGRRAIPVEDAADPPLGPPRGHMAPLAQGEARKGAFYRACLVAELEADRAREPR